jgi:hypothetical protein
MFKNIPFSAGYGHFLWRRIFRCDGYAVSKFDLKEFNQFVRMSFVDLKCFLLYAEARKSTYIMTKIDSSFSEIRRDKTLLND